MVQALPYKGVKVHKSRAAFISTNLRSWGIKALNQEDLLASLWINNAKFISVEKSNLEVRVQALR